MARMSTILAFIVMTFLCWGSYGPVLHEGQEAMGRSLWRPFILVGVAYFLVAACVPLVLRKLTDEPGKWTMSGVVWSLLAGAVGALGSLGILLAFSQGGRPVVVMPLVFGCAPVVNTFVTMIMGKTARQARLPFFLGVLFVALGAAGVLRHNPTASNKQAVATVRFQIDGQAPEIEGTQVRGNWLIAQGEDVASVNRRVLPQLLENDVNILGLRAGSAAPLATVLYIVITALCWGTYGPLLHKGQSSMSGSRLRPFICVGIAYFFVAILIPTMILLQAGEPGGFSFSGSLWSLAAGVLGAAGALGVIMAFNLGGRPVVVMPLVFGGAPVVNTFVSMLQSQLKDGSIGTLTNLFLASLATVIVGATMVLVFAPRMALKPQPSLPESRTTPSTDSLATSTASEQAAT